MGTYQWGFSTDDAANAIQARFNVEAGALAAWARYTVETLHYLQDLDAAVVSGQPVGGHNDQFVDIAHGRWALSSALTALDLCAASLGVGILPPLREPRRYSLPELVGRAEVKRASASAAAWVGAVSDDATYREIRALRNQLVHSRAALHLYATSTGGPRTCFRAVVAGKQVAHPVDQLVLLCRDTATRYVSQFLAQGLDPGF